MNDCLNSWLNDFRENWSCAKSNPILNALTLQVPWKRFYVYDIRVQRPEVPRIHFSRWKSQKEQKGPRNMLLNNFFNRYCFSTTKVYASLTNFQTIFQRYTLKHHILLNNNWKYQRLLGNSSQQLCFGMAVFSTHIRRSLYYD